MGLDHAVVVSLFLSRALLELFGTGPKKAIGAEKGEDRPHRAGRQSQVSACRSLSPSSA
ncbi:MAG: hypothetical protein QM783_10845 [Phycisphaerales bacterium]